MCDHAIKKVKSEQKPDGSEGFDEAESEKGAIRTNIWGKRVQIILMLRKPVLLILSDWKGI